jgi:hypothetical protein
MLFMMNNPFQEYILLGLLAAVTIRFKYKTIGFDQGPRPLPLHNRYIRTGTCVR